MSGGRQKTAATSASSPAPECGPRLTPLPRLASWEFTWCVRTPGVGSSFQDSGARKSYTRDICIKEAPTPMLLEESPPLWPRPPLGHSGRGQGQRPRKETPTLFQPRVLLVELEGLRPVLFRQESETHFLGLWEAAEGGLSCHKESSAQSGETGLHRCSDSESYDPGQKGHLAGPGREGLTSVPQFDAKWFFLPANLFQAATGNLFPSPSECFFQKVCTS